MPANFTVIMRSELIIIRFFSLRKSDISLPFSTESAVFLAGGYNVYCDDEVYDLHILARL